MSGADKLKTLLNSCESVVISGGQCTLKSWLSDH